MMWGGPGPWWPLLIVMPLLMAAAAATVLAVMTRSGHGPFRGPGQHGSLREHERGQDQRAGEDPLAVLRERYARGEISHEEFDRYLDRLVRTEPGLEPGHGGGRD